jgi:chromosomal replication initiation ATPase DnaA
MTVMEQVQMLERGPVTMRAVRRAVAQAFGVSEADIIGRDRVFLHAAPRQVSYLLCNRICRRTVSDIGHYAGRDHGTIWQGVRRVRRYMAVHAGFAEAIHKLEHSILQGGISLASGERLEAAE